MSEQPRKLMRMPSVIETTGKGRTTIYEEIKLGTFPPSIPIGNRSVAWDSYAIAKWIEEKIKNAKRVTVNNDVQSDVQGGKL